MGRGGFTGRDVYSDHLTAIIDEISSDAEIKRMTIEIRDVEKSVRNISAHNLISVTENWVKKYSGYLPMEIYNMLKNYVKKLQSPREKTIKVKYIFIIICIFKSDF